MAWETGFRTICYKKYLSHDAKKFITDISDKHIFIIDDEFHNVNKARVYDFFNTIVFISFILTYLLFISFVLFGLLILPILTCGNSMLPVCDKIYWK